MSRVAQTARRASSVVASPLGTQEYFEEIHRRSADPFGLLDRLYERRKRRIALSMLGREHYGSAFEPGCSIGAVSGELARLCDEVISMDGVESALRRARDHLAASVVGNVTLVRGLVPGDWPPGEFDLVVLGELCYYLEPAELDEVADLAAGSLAGGGELLAVHWRAPIENCALTGDDVHRRLRAHRGLEQVASYEEALFVVDLFVAGGHRGRGGRRGLPRP